MKLLSLLKEGKRAKLQETLAEDREFQTIIGNLKGMPGHYVIAAIEKFAYSPKNKVYKDAISDMLDDVEAMYKAVDAKVAKMLEQKAAEIDSTMMQEKSNQLELIKKHASDIQDSLKVETKKSKKKK